MFNHHCDINVGPKSKRFRNVCVPVCVFVSVSGVSVYSISLCVGVGVCFWVAVFLCLSLYSRSVCLRLCVYLYVSVSLYLSAYLLAVGLSVCEYVSGWVGFENIWLCVWEWLSYPLSLSLLILFECVSLHVSNGHLEIMCSVMYTQLRRTGFSTSFKMSCCCCCCCCEWLECNSVGESGEWLFL